MPTLHPVNSDLTYLLKQKITRYRIARLLNVADNTVFAWYIGFFSPTPPNAAKLAKLRQHVERFKTYETFKLDNHNSAVSVR